MTEPTREQKHEMIASLAHDLEPIVETIEAKHATTKNHYGDYMSVLSMLGEPRTYTLLACARIEAKKIIGNQPKWAIKNMVRALQMMPALNNGDDWQRLSALKTLGYRVTVTIPESV